MALRVVKGNLFEDGAEAWVNTVNTVGVMGKGVALQFSRAFPEMVDDYKQAVASGELKIGSVQLWRNPGLHGPRFIVNVPTKRHWRGPSRLDYVRQGSRALLLALEAQGIRSVAMPPLGCGAGGLAWSEVLPVLMEVFGEADHIEAVVYAPQGAPPASSMPDFRQPVELNEERAAACAILDFYNAASMERPSLVALQKLAYLYQELGGDLRLSFARGPYGPYSDGLRRALVSLEGQYIVGFGDGTRQALDEGQLETLPGVSARALEVLGRATQKSRAFEELKRLTEGFETTYGLELLATVHWAASRGGTAGEVDQVVKYIAGWSERKSRLFPEQHIAVALARLQKFDLASPPTGRAVA